MKYSLPDEPPIGSKVVTPLGFVYERKPHSDISGRNWEYDGVSCNWDTLCAVGVEDYINIEDGDAYYRPESPDFYPELKVRIKGEWKYFYFDSDENCFGTLSILGNNEREWKQVGS